MNEYLHHIERIQHIQCRSLGQTFWYETEGEKFFDLTEIGHSRVWE